MAKKKKLKTRYTLAGGKVKTKFISAVKIRKSAKALLRTLREEAGSDSRVLVMAGGHKVIDR